MPKTSNHGLILLCRFSVLDKNAWANVTDKGLPQTALNGRIAFKL